jgi:hypothetical protein
MLFDRLDVPFSTAIPTATEFLSGNVRRRKPIDRIFLRFFEFWPHAFELTKIKRMIHRTSEIRAKVITTE